MTTELNLYDRLSAVETANKYFEKDRKKAAGATKFIGRGSAASSTNRYMLAAGDLANCGRYDSSDRVFVSVEGNRRGRVPLDLHEVGLAVLARATLVADNKHDRERPYNVGERELCSYLESHGYFESAAGVWSPHSDSGKAAIADIEPFQPRARGFERLREKD
jgi:hypothetical protein